MHSRPSTQRRQSRSPSRRQSRSPSRNQSQRQPSPKMESTKPPPPVTAPPAQQNIISSPPVTAPPAQQYTIESSTGVTPQAQQDVIESAPPVATRPQTPQLHGKEDLQNLPPDTLKNKYGKFQVQHGVKDGPQPPFYQSYSTKIEMEPNIRTRSSKSLGTRGSDIDFVQVVRSGTGDNWRTTAQDHGWKGATDESGKPINSEGKPQFLHRPELTEQQTGTGWRVDQSEKSSPFHQESAPEDKAKAKVGRHHLLKENETAELKDSPTIAGPGYKFDAMSTAMDKKSGKEFGTVEWGFKVEQNAQGESTIKDRPPTLLEDNLKLKGPEGEAARERDRGRRAAYEQWNQAAPGKEQAIRDEMERRKAVGADASQIKPPQQVTRLPI